MDIDASVNQGPEAFVAAATAAGWKPAYGSPFQGRPSIRRFVPLPFQDDFCVFGDRHPVGEPGVLVCTPAVFESTAAGTHDGLRSSASSRMISGPQRLVYLQRVACNCVTILYLRVTNHARIFNTSAAQGEEK